MYFCKYNPSEDRRLSAFSSLPQPDKQTANTQKKQQMAGIKEIEEIFACWRMEGEQSLLFLYGIILRTRDLEQIQIADKYLIGTYKQAEEMLKK